MCIESDECPDSQKEGEKDRKEMASTPTLPLCLDLIIFGTCLQNFVADHPATTTETLSGGQLPGLSPCLRISRVNFSGQDHTHVRHDLSLDGQHLEKHVEAIPHFEGTAQRAQLAFEAHHAAQESGSVTSHA